MSATSIANSRFPLAVILIFPVISKREENLLAYNEIQWARAEPPSRCSLLFKSVGLLFRVIIVCGQI